MLYTHTHEANRMSLHGETAWGRKRLARKLGELTSTQPHIATSKVRNPQQFNAN